MNWSLFFVALIVIALGCLASFVAWPPLLLVVPWLLSALGVMFFLMSFKKPLLPLSKYPRPAGMNEVQAGLIEKFFAKCEVLEGHKRRPHQLEEFLHEEDKLHLLIQACLAAGISREYLKELLEPRGCVYFTMGRGSGETFRVIG